MRLGKAKPVAVLAAGVTTLAISAPAMAAPLTIGSDMVTATDGAVSVMNGARMMARGGAVRLTDGKQMTMVGGGPASGMSATRMPSMPSGQMADCPMMA